MKLISDISRRESNLALYAGFAIAVLVSTGRNLAQTVSADRPNVILIITDDQGYGDLTCHGNTMLSTSHLDRLARESVRFSNFHVDPTCAETRAALMTGKYSCRVGVWHTIMGRSILRPNERTMAQYFAGARYRTGLFGKWHLGDNWPYRPHDRGFHEALYHGGGGVGQSPDAWGNDYFDDTYQRNGEPEPQHGYCTDVFFSAALKFIEANRDRPFFCHIATNAPHAPYNVDPKYAQPFLDRGVAQPMANFYGMIQNIDENVGRLLDKLDEWNLAQNTILIFMTDNGTAAGVQPDGGSRPNSKQPPSNQTADAAWKGFSAGMKAQKGSQYDGGHRVPCFIRWPNAKWIVGREVPDLAAHFDLLPTLIDLCQLAPTGALKLDGTSLVPLLQTRSKNPATNATHFPDRTLVVHSQRVDFPEKWRKFSVMHGSWRLVDGKELYDLSTDSSQTNDIATELPQMVNDLRRKYESWWQDVSPSFHGYSDIPLGAPEAPRTQLCCHDWHPVDKGVPWNQSGQEGVQADPAVNGQWAVEVRQAGKYAFILRSRPEGVPYRLPAGTARIKIGEVEGKVDVAEGAESATVTLPLEPAGHKMLQTWLDSSDGKISRGAFYVTVEFRGASAQ